MKALITGAGSGIGRGIALGLARRGVALGLVGRRSAALAETAALAAAFTTQAVLLPCDLAQPAERQQLHAACQAQLGPIDILVCNAANLGGGALANQSQTALTDTIAVNLVASIDLVRRFQPDLAARQGIFVAVSSSTSAVPLPYLALYSASKAGLDAFARSVQYELRQQRIHTLLVYPPATATALTAGMAAQARWFPRADPLWVGERIAAAILARRSVLDLQRGEQMLTWLYRLWPGLVRRILQGQARRFEQLTK